MYHATDFRIFLGDIFVDCLQILKSIILNSLVPNWAVRCKASIEHQGAHFNALSWRYLLTVVVGSWIRNRTRRVGNCIRLQSYALCGRARSKPTIRDSPWHAVSLREYPSLIRLLVLQVHPLDPLRMVHLTILDHIIRIDKIAGLQVCFAVD